MSDGKDAPQILIEALEATCIIGLNDWERVVRQKVVLDIVLTVKPSAPPSDDEPPPVDYRALTKRLLEMVEASRFKLLETLAETVAAHCLKDDNVSVADVTVRKPAALRYANSVGVRVRRARV